MVVAFLWIILMQVIAGFMVWTSMLAMIVLSALAFHGCLRQYQYFASLTSDELSQRETEKLDNYLDIDMTSLVKVQLDSILSNKKVWLLFTIVAGLIFFVLSVTFIFLRKRVRIAISLIREASKQVQPLFVFCILFFNHNFLFRINCTLCLFVQICPQNLICSLH